MTTTQRPLDGTVALVTGAGRGRGIGRATAIRLAQAGADVIVADLARPRPDLQVETVGLGDTMEALRETANAVRAQGVRCEPVALDITVVEEVHAAIDVAVHTFGRLDVLVNNAGNALGVGEFADIPDRSWELSWQVNVLGTVRMCRAALPRLAEHGRGAIVNVASTGGLAAMPRYGAYTLAKHAIVGLTRLLAVELGPQGIRVNAVAPGFIHTDMGSAELEFIARETGQDVGSATASVITDIPLRRFGRPEDVAEAISWLAGAGDYVNGAVLTVHGGLVAGLN